MKSKEFNGLSSEELKQKEIAFKKDLHNLYYERKMGRVDKPSRFKALKRDIARILTILREREIEDERSTKKNQ